MTNQNHPKAVDLSIIIPAKNENEQLLRGTLDKLSEWLKKRDYGKVEVVLVTPQGDRSAKVARAKKPAFANLRVIEFRNDHGKGSAVRIGVFEAKGRFRLFMDADLATPLRHLDEAWRQLSGGADVVIAVRDLWRIHKGLLRKLITKVANIVLQILLVPGIKDTQCGFKGFSAAAAQAIFSRQTLLRWSFDAEILKIARLLKYRVTYIQAPDWHDPKKVGLVGESALKIAIAEFKDPFVILWRALRGRYKTPSYRYAKAQEVATET